MRSLTSQALSMELNASPELVLRDSRASEKSGPRVRPLPRILCELRCRSLPRQLALHHFG